MFRPLVRVNRSLRPLAPSVVSQSIIRVRMAILLTSPYNTTPPPCKKKLCLCL
jgi:hypothetical protein